MESPMKPLTTGPGEASTSAPDDRQTGWPIARLLAILLAALVLITAAAVMALTWGASLRNTFDFLNQRSIDLTQATLASIQAHLLPAENFANQTLEAIDQRKIDPANREAFSHWLMGGMAAAPQIRAMGVASPDGTGWTVRRTQGLLMLEDHSRASPEAIRQAFADARERSAGPYWADVVYVGGASLINLRVLVLSPSGEPSLLVIAISLQELSQHLAERNRAKDWTGFILSGKNHVLAHPLFAAQPEVLSEQAPLMPLSSIPDPVLRHIWNGKESARFQEASEAGVDVRFDDIDDPKYIFVTGSTSEFGKPPWFFGAYTRLDTVDEQYERAIGSGIAASGLVVIAVLIAIAIGHHLAKPLRSAAEVAGRIGRLELDDLPTLPKSRVRELAQQAAAFNQMADGLRAFSTYVPRPLVQLLAKRGFRGNVPAVTSDTTVLFTDIISFTSLAEPLTAAESAALLNHHFRLLGDIVHQEGGIIDKYIGDSLMAFWAAPLSEGNGPERAIVAGQRIAAALHKDNRQRSNDGERPIQVRIGIHTGPALVGNIGAAGRVNYTVVGDTVNVAQRLQDFGRNIEPGEDCVILASEETVDRVAAPLRGERIGMLPIRGRETPVVGWRIPLPVDCA
jgi:adenylate cyclase